MASIRGCFALIRYSCNSIGGLAIIGFIGHAIMDFFGFFITYIYCHFAIFVDVPIRVFGEDCILWIFRWWVGYLVLWLGGALCCLWVKHGNEGVFLVTGEVPGRGVLVSLFFMVLRILVCVTLTVSRELSGIGIRYSCLPLVGFTVRRGNTSVVRRVSVRGAARTPLGSMRIRVAARPTFNGTIPAIVRTVPTGSQIYLRAFGLALSAGCFARLARELSNDLGMRVASRAGTVFSRACPVSVLTCSR